MLDQISVFVENKKGRLAAIMKLINDNGIDIRSIDESLGKPSDCFGLTAACTVPDQIPATHAIFQHILLTAQHSAKLVEAREYHIAFIVYKHKLTDDTQQHITL